MSTISDITARYERLAGKMLGFTGSWWDAPTKDDRHPGTVLRKRNSNKNSIPGMWVYSVRSKNLEFVPQERRHGGHYQKWTSGVDTHDDARRVAESFIK